MESRPSKQLEPTGDNLEVIKDNTLIEASRKLGRSRETIRRWRKAYLPDMEVRLGRPNRELPSNLIAALGTATDAELSRLYNIPKNTVRNYRIARQIPPHPRIPELPSDLIAALGTAPDTQLARAYNVPASAVRNTRIAMQIAPYARGTDGDQGPQ